MTKLLQRKSVAGVGSLLIALGAMAIDSSPAFAQESGLSRARRPLFNPFQRARASSLTSRFGLPVSSSVTTSQSAAAASASSVPMVAGGSVATAPTSSPMLASHGDPHGPPAGRPPFRPPGRSPFRPP